MRIVPSAVAFSVFVLLCPGVLWRLQAQGQDLANSQLQTAEQIQRIAFGSCATQQSACPIWGTITDYRPDILLLLGDNIYADVVDGQLKPATPDRIAESYRELALVPGFQRLRGQTPIMATWDDHDYGNNDAGVEWEHKDAAAKLFHDFLGTPADSHFRKQRGIYNAKIFGPVGRRLQVIMLDTRYFRSEMDKAERPLPGFRARPYLARNDPAATILGDAQWKWLEEQLLKPAEVRLLCSSIQVVSDEHPFEKWDNFPLERQRLYDLIRKTEASGVIVLSGDRHRGEISMDPYAVSYPLYDVTASGLNQASDKWQRIEPNRYRVAGLEFGNHFGAIEINWEKDDPQISLQLRWEDGDVAVQTRVALSLLKAEKRPEPLPAGVLSPQEAIAEEEGTQVDVQFVVRGGRAIGDRQRLLLNSQTDFRSEQNFTVVVNQSALTEQWSQLDETALFRKTIRVQGIITLHNGTKQLVVERPEQLQIVDSQSSERRR